MGMIIRVMVADDSSVTRRIVSEAIAREPDMELVGAAQDGEEAISFFKSQKPDLVLLDVDMPTLNGLEALKAIRKINDSVPVIMFSTLTVKGGEATLDALSAGATDYVAKPAGVGHLNKAMDYLRQELIPRVRMWGARFKSRQEKAAQASAAAPQKTNGMVSSTTPAPDKDARGSASFTLTSSKPDVSSSQPAPRRRSVSVDVLAIGSSTGGPNALAELIGLLPGDLGVPVLITQHMPPVFTQLLAERLDRGSRLKVKEAFDGAVVKAGEAWIAPGDFHMVVTREGTETILRINKNAPENSCRPAVDVMFRSIAEVYGASTVACVLTGMGRDGTAGAQVLAKTGACILAQDEASSVVWGMPRAVYEAGIADAVLNLKDMAAAVTTRIRGSNNAATLTATR
jgi:two-component system, chemotaxis family, protein-glutamate methylesterase/glutaminase